MNVVDPTFRVCRTMFGDSTLLKHKDRFRNIRPSKVRTVYVCDGKQGRTHERELKLTPIQRDTLVSGWKARWSNISLQL